MVALNVVFELSYGQLAVFASSLLHPFNDWTDSHVSQGFSWRPGSVSFRSMVETGRHTLNVDITDHVGQLHPHALRAVDVPFEVPADGSVEVGSIGDTVQLSLPAGMFLLRCEFLRPIDALAWRGRLTFARDDPLRFAIVLADPELSVGAELVTTAAAALG